MMFIIKNTILIIANLHVSHLSSRPLYHFNTVSIIQFRNRASRLNLLFHQSSSIILFELQFINSWSDPFTIIFPVQQFNIMLNHKYLSSTNKLLLFPKCIYYCLSLLRKNSIDIFSCFYSILSSRKQKLFNSLECSNQFDCDINA